MVDTVRQSHQPHDAWGTAVVLALILVSGLAGFWWANREATAAARPVAAAVN